MHYNDRVLAFRPPSIAIGLLLLAAIAWQLLPLELHNSLPLAAPGTAVAGFAIMLRAWWLFRRTDNAICPTSETTSLITGDIYAISRNPMYLGMAMMLTAAGMQSGTLSFYVAAIVFVAIINRHFIPYEEAKLEQTFAIEFRDYAASVRRWI